MSLNKEDILNHLKGLEIEVILLHGAALVMHGIKETTNDIDCKAVDELSNFFTSKTQHLLVGEKFEYGLFDFGYMGVSLPPVRYTKLDGVLVQTVESVMEQKLVFNRPKDIEAIKLCSEKTGVQVHIDNLELYRANRATKGDYRLGKHGENLIGKGVTSANAQDSDRVDNPTKGYYQLGDNGNNFYW